MPVIYKMSQTMYDTLRYPMRWDRRQKKLVKVGKPVSKKEILEHINSSFGLLRKVEDISIF